MHQIQATAAVASLGLAMSVFVAAVDHGPMSTASLTRTNTQASTRKGDRMRAILAAPVFVLALP
jgi:hypothetical protein